MPASKPSPAQVTHALTLKGAQLTWAILERLKTIENRSVRLPPGWVALHTGMGKLAPARAAELAIQCPGIPSEASLPHGFIVGAIRVDRCCDIGDCAGTASEPWALGPVCNVIGAVVLLPAPIAHKGSLGLWPIDAHVIALVQAGCAAAPVLENDMARLPAPTTTSSYRRTPQKRKLSDLSKDGASPGTGTTSGAASSQPPLPPVPPVPPAVAAPQQADFPHLAWKLHSLAPGTSQEAAERALVAHGNNLVAASYFLQQRVPPSPVKRHDGLASSRLMGMQG